MASFVRNTMHSLLNALPAHLNARIRDSYKNGKKDWNDFLAKSSVAGANSGYRRILTQIPLFDNMSLIPVNEEWKAKWADAKDRRVLLYAYKDYSGSLYKWAEAINRHSSYAARLVTSQAHPYGYSSDILALDSVPRSTRKAASRFAEGQENILKLVEEATVIHYKEELKLFEEAQRGSKVTLSSMIMDRAQKAHIPQVFTFCGGYARKYMADPDYIAFVSKFDARVAMTPDLNYEWFAGSYIPHAIDTEKIESSWSDGSIISHSPSASIRKGTKEFVEAMRAVVADRPSLAMDLISGVPHRECMDRKMKATLFFDQAGREKDRTWGEDGVIGWYGNSAIEAMAFGIPTIAHLSESAFQGAARAGKDIQSRCPVLRVGCEDTNSLYKAISGFFDMSPEQRRESSERTRAWAVEFHGYESVAKQLESLYESFSESKS